MRSRTHERKRRPPSKRRAEKRARPRVSARACTRQDDHPLARVRAIKKNQRRRWATNRSLISQVASFKFKEWRTGQKPCGLPDRFYIIASFGISRPHRLEAPGANPGFELRARALLAGADRCEGGKKDSGGPAEVTIIRVNRMGDEGEAEEVACFSFLPSRRLLFCRRCVFEH